jgi:hypothetical protein
MTQETKRQRRRFSPDEIEARTRAVLIMTLAGVLGFSVIAILYSLVFVYQPMEQSPNDKAFFEILSPMMFSIAGALTGLAAGGALKRNRQDDSE